MLEYSPTQQIIQLSFEELKYVMQWVRERERSAPYPVTILIGGWAVDAYNRWYGSIDIDLVTNHKTREYLKQYLINHRGFEHHRELGLHTVAKNAAAGKIIIDFLSRDIADPFEGRSETLDFNILKGNTVIKKIRDQVIADIPTRSLLLIFKLKAVWDRTYRIQRKTSNDTVWDQAKRIKDCGDVLALIDPNFGGEDLDLRFLGEQFSAFGFLIDCLKNIPENKAALSKYMKMDYETAHRTCNNLLLLVSG